MKSISIRELHRRTGHWVRDARKHGVIIVQDRNVPIARITPLSDERPVNPLAKWRPTKTYAAAFRTPVMGTPAEQIISEDRDRG